MWRLLIVELIVVLLIAGIWLLGPLIGLASVAARLAVILVLALPPLGLLIGRLVQRRRRKKALREQGEEEGAPASPDHGAELKRLANRLKDAFRALKAVKVAGRSPLRALPWYIVIGPPGAGKSTMLRRSGLNFSFVSVEDEAGKTSDGKRNVAWCVSDKAILVDTPGQHSVDGEEPEWSALLRLLRRRRVQLNGVIVCASVTDVSAAPPQQIEATAAKIRERVDELVEHLEAVVPVYVLFSKCDLVRGFVDSFGQMKDGKRLQVFGFTVPFSDHGGKVGVVFDEELELLARSLRARSLARLGLVRPSLRPGLYEFPLQLSAARKPLGVFVKRLFLADAYRETPRMRGVYFCSARQEGRPVDCLVSAVEDAFGFRRSVPPEQRREEKSYFLHELFTNVIPCDKDLAFTTERGRKRQLRFRLATLAATTVVAGTVLGLATTSYRNNLSLVRSTGVLAERTRSPDDNIGQGGASLPALGRLAERVQLLADHQREGPPLTYRFGYYSGHLLRDPLQRVFVGQVGTKFVEPVDLEIRKALAAVASGRTGAKDKSVAWDYDLLKTAIMVTTPQHLDVRFAGRILVGMWKKCLGPDVVGQDDLLDRVAKVYLQLIKDGRTGWPELDHSLLRDVRRALRARDVEFHRLVADIRDVPPDIALQDVLRGTVQTAITSSASVPGIYTRLGWERYMRDKLARREGVEPWVLGDETSPDLAAARLSDRYFDEYAQKWTTFIRGLTLAQPTSAKDSLDLLKVLTDDPPLYEKLFKTIVYQTTLPSKANAVAGRAQKLLEGKGAAAKLLADRALRSSRGPKNSVERAFASLKDFVDPPGGADGQPRLAGLKQYLDQLVTVRDELKAFLANTEQPDATRLNKALADAQQVTDLILKGLHPRGLRSDVGSLLYRPLLAVTSQAQETQAALTAGSFANEVCAAFNEKLAGRYPFAPSDRDALLADTAEFFRYPGGTAWTYHAASLKTHLVESGDRYQVVGGAKIPATIVAFYNGALRVTRALFPHGADAPLLEFEVQPRPAVVSRGAGYAVSKISLEVGDQKKTYSNGPLETWRFKWPRERGSARLVVRGDRGLREELTARGDWALMRLIGRATVKRHAPWYYVVWPLKNGRIQIRMDFRPSRTRNPLFDNLRLHCR